MKYLEILSRRFSAWGLVEKFDFCIFDDLDNCQNIVYYEGITAEEIGQLWGGN